MTDKAAPTQKKATITGMKAQGFYNKHSAPQWATIRYVLPWLSKAATNLVVPETTNALRFADFGCSEGANSIKIMAQLSEATRQTSTKPIRTNHCDLPSNDYSTLLHTIGNREQAPYTDPSVFGSIVGGSMYNQLMPPGSVHLATCFNAIGFLSKRPLERLPDCILPNGPGRLATQGSISAQEKKACDEQAEHDLKSFLKVRASELATGGKLLLQSFVENDQVSTADGIIDALDDALRDHIAAGAISQETYERYYHPVYMRNQDQLVAPVKPESGDLSHLFTLEKTECYETPVPFVEQFREDGNKESYARQMVSFFRAFTEAALTHALSGTPNPNTLLDSIYTRAEERIREAPHLYPYQFISVAMLLTRTGTR